MPRDGAHVSAQQLQPERAIVAPRAALPSGITRPLEQVIRSIREKHGTGVIWIHGEAGSGKTTAMRHLAAVLGDIQIFDSPRSNYWKGPAADELIVVASPELPPKGTGRLREIVTLARWNADDCIAYLAVVHRPKVANVMQRITADARLHTFGGLPALVRIALDEFAADESLASGVSAIRRHLQHCEFRLHADDRLGFIPLIDRMLQARTIVQNLLESRVPYLALSLVGRELFPDLAIELSDAPGALKRVDEVLRGPDRSADAAAASLLLRADSCWRPRVGRPLALAGAILNGAMWHGIDLQDSRLDRAQFCSADLSNAVLNRITAVWTDFTRANLTEARLDRCIATSAIFAAANMERIRAEAASLLGADLRHARLRQAHLVSADLGLADLTDADLMLADLRLANLKGTLVRTDLSRADLTGANLEHADLQTALLDGTRFFQARMLDCHLESVAIRGPDFERADLGFAHLTGSKMREGNFREAILRSAELANIDWEGADLRGADLAKASFHLGSSRSGLVGSVIPAEGSKTGFYTDDYNEQDFKCPEDIRKANLCGADLRGAKIDGVDFYLVDLRGAKYTPDQADHFARCGAILRSRAA